MTTTKTTAVLCSLLLTSLATARLATAAPLGYPTTEHASFLVDVPSDWEVSPGEEEGDYVNLNGPTGATVSMRTIPGGEEDLHAAIDEASAFLEETYSNVTVTAPAAMGKGGLPGFSQGGTGKNKADGNDMLFAMVWVALPDGHIGEIWAAVKKGDPGAAAAVKIVESFHTP